MAWHNWFLFDLGNTVVKLAYERVLQRLSADTSVSRDDLMRAMEGGGGYRDLERGSVSFAEFYQFLRERAGYRGSLASLRDIWTDFFDGPVDGMEEMLERVRASYRVAFLSNSNEIHAEYIPRHFSSLFRRDDRFVFSHVHGCAKPDRMIYERALQILGALPNRVVFVDDLIENISTARDVGMAAYQFHGATQLAQELERDGILTAPDRPGTW
ncbi:MAG: HAD family phosphatase [Thermoanaerobaculia bacterium]|jgi:putative hydrolase of the HAD superfamily